MKIPWGDLAMAIGGGLFLNWMLEGRGGELPEPVVRERFVEQPTAVYLERVIWALTRDFDIRKIREIRNFLNEEYSEVQECYRLQLPPDLVAKRVERSLLEGRRSFSPSSESAEAAAEAAQAAASAPAATGTPTTG